MKRFSDLKPVIIRSQEKRPPPEPLPSVTGLGSSYIALSTAGLALSHLPILLTSTVGARWAVILSDHRERGFRIVSAPITFIPKVRLNVAMGVLAEPFGQFV
jgi:hypothetical protein